MFAKQILLGLAAVAFAAAVSAAPLKVETRSIKEKKPTFEIDVSYPRTGVAAVDGPIETWAKAAAADFRTLTDDMGGTPGPWNIEAGFEIARNDDQMFAVVFTESGYTGGAHGYATTRTFNFLRPEGTEVELPELVTPRGMKIISDISIAQVTKARSGPEGMTDSDWIKRGAGPNARNYRAFVLTPTALNVFFDAYQVAAYAAGPQEAHIPLSAIKAELRADPRAPVASFDCAAARSDIETAICSSRDLARLDRHVAEAYAEKLSWAEDDAARRTIQQAQREWLQRRDGVCLRAGQPLVACLSDSYRRRLQALNDPSE
jgi:uncharacterized protein YecT (DUF1311 family)